MMKVIEVNFLAPDANIAIVVARFNKFINNNLLDGAIDTLKRIGQVKSKNITIIWIPGVYELPLTAHVLAKSCKYHAIIALGTLIQGDTAHFKYIASAGSNGIANVSVTNQIPVTFGILTTKNINQAIERAGTKVGNKGGDAALAALEMINVLKAVES